MLCPYFLSHPFQSVRNAQIAPERLKEINSHPWIAHVLKIKATSTKNLFEHCSANRRDHSFATFPKEELVATHPEYDHCTHGMHVTQPKWVKIRPQP